MDQAALQLLARIKIRLRQEKGVVLNTQRFFSEPDYAAQLLDAAEESENIELVTASLEIRTRLGWIDLNTSHTSAQKTPGNGAESSLHSGASEASRRYVFGARS